MARPPRAAPKPSARAVELVRAGCTAPEAAAATGVALSTVHRACSRAGVACPAVPLQPPAARLIPVTIRMTEAQRDKLQAMPDGAARVREWIDAAPINRPGSR